MESFDFENDPEVRAVLDRLKATCARKPFSDIVDDQGHQYVDLVMEGGGVLGIALVGYTYVLERMGIRFLGVGGTSAGAINALLIAAAAAPQEAKSHKIIPLLAGLDCDRFVDGGFAIRHFVDDWIKHGVNFSLVVPFPWVYESIEKHLGLNPGDVFLGWLSNAIGSFGIHTARDLQGRLNQKPDGLKHREGHPLAEEQAAAYLALVATEVVTETKVELPRMAGLFWSDPDAVDPALFVRASMSIPFFFQPLTLNDLPRGSAVEACWLQQAGFAGPIPESCTLVDGGVMSNFPIDLFHIPNQVPSAPTFGVKLGVGERHNPVTSPLSMAQAVFNAARHCLDYDFIRRNPDYRHLVAQIDTGPHNWLRAPYSCIAYAARFWNQPAMSFGVTSCKAEPNAA